MKMLFDTLCVLARPAERQLDYLRSLFKGIPNFEGIPNIDELALEFDDCYQSTLEFRQVNPELFKVLDQLDAHFSSFSGRKYESLWTADALMSAPEWTRVRVLAKRCLNEMECP